MDITHGIERYLLKENPIGATDYPDANKLRVKP